MDNLHLVMPICNTMDSMSSSDSSSSDSDDVSSDSSLGHEGRDLIARCVELPKFLLTHSEYSAIDVPQMKNFRMNTEKTKKSKTVKAREFLATFDDRESSKLCFAIVCSLIALILLGAVVIAVVQILDQHD